MSIYEFVSATVVGSSDEALPGFGLRLGQNYPNPFNPSTTISFVLPHESHVRLSIYDIRGGHVKTVRNETLPEGYREVVWDGRDERGRGVSSGVYFYRLTAGDQTLTKKMVQLR